MIDPIDTTGVEEDAPQFELPINVTLSLTIAPDRPDFENANPAYAIVGTMVTTDGKTHHMAFTSDPEPAAILGVAVNILAQSFGMTAVPVYNGDGSEIDYGEPGAMN